MNHIFTLVWNATTNTWVAASEATRSRSKPGRTRRAASVASVASVALFGFGSLGFTPPSLAAGSGLQLCDPSTASGSSVGSAGVFAGVGCTSNRAFSLNNAGTDNGAEGVAAATARVSGYQDGLLELRGDAGISVMGVVNMNGSKITQVAEGTLSATSADAVNGSQLYATNQDVAANTTAITDLDGRVTNNTTAITDLDGRVTNNTTSITDLDGRVTTHNAAITNIDSRVTQNAGDITNLTQSLNSGQAGLVRQDAISKTITVAKDLDGSLVDVTGTAGARKLTGVSAGALSAASLDAVNGSQLYDTNQNVVANTTAISNLDGRVTTNSTAITHIDQRVTQNTGDISNLAQSLNSGESGLVRQDAITRNISVAKDLDGTVVDLTGTAGARKLNGVSAGALNAASLDAVNGSQLYATNQNVAANTTAISSLDGRVTTNSTAITHIDQRVTQNTGDISNLAQSLNSGESGLVRQDAITRNISVAKDLDGTVVDLTGTAGARKLNGVSAGALNAASLDAVNGSQLYATNQNVLANTTALNTLDGLVAQNAADLGNLTASLNNGALGLVKQDAISRVISVGQDQDGNLVDINGTAGARQLHGVADGMIAAGSLYAVNGGQLHNVSDSVASALGGGAFVGANGAIVAPSYSVGGTVYRSVGAAVAGLDTRVTQMQTTVNNVEAQMASGELGLVKADALTGTITVAAGKGGNLVDMSGTDGSRKVTGVANGAISADSTDAVNGSQLYALSQQVGDMNAANDYVKVDGADDGSDAAVVAAGTKAVAVGSNASASAANSVALGANSVADRANTVSVGSKGAERQVANVAAGTQKTDVVNVGQFAPVVASLGGGAGIDASTGMVTGPSYQLDGQTYNNVGDALGSLDANMQQNREGLSRLDSRLDQTDRAMNDIARNAYSGIAAATALTMVPEVDQGKNFALGVGAATYRGYQAIAIGASARVNQRVKLKAGVGIASAGATAGVGASMQW